jgi:hypothetical protein
MVEGTLAGLAAGLVAQKMVPLDEAAIHSTLLEIILDDKVVDIALVDAVVYDDPFVGSRAVWDMDKVRQIFLNRAEPDTIGLSAIGGLLQPIRPEEPHGLNLILGPSGRRVTAPVAPGMIKTVTLSSRRVMNLDQAEAVITRPSVMALDGEREVEIKEHQAAMVRLKKDGPIIVNVGRAMTSAMKRGVLTSEEIKP